MLVLIALTGGASKIDVSSLIILKPAAVLACAVAFVTLRRSQLVAYRWLFVGIGAAFVLCLVQLVPLPPALWHALPGHQDILSVDTATGLGGAWRPLTLTPMNGWHAVTSLFVPLAVLLLGVQLNRDDLHRLLPLIILLGALSGLLGLLQVVGGGETLYLYRGNNDGTAAGLFANRNHAALLLAILFPLLVAWATSEDADRRRIWLRQWAAIAASVVLFPMILVTGSRSGLILSVIGLLTALATVVLGGGARAMSRPKLAAIAAAGVTGVGLLATLSIWLSKAEALTRLIHTSRDSEFRLDIWTVSLDLLWKYFPFGSGIGSFVETYQAAEPAYQLNPSYRNHAHQDILEVGMTLGLPGLIILAAAAIFLGRHAVAAWTRRAGDQRAVGLARMASVAMLMIVLASLADYPLRTPIIMAVFAVLSLWLLEPGRQRGAASRGERGNG